MTKVRINELVNLESIDYEQIMAAPFDSTNG